MTALELKELSKRFGDVTALEGLDLAVAEGEFCVFLGPSGCGKSTALRCVAGLESPTSGDVRIDGRSVLGTEPKDRDVAMVFQSYALYPHMDVRRNLAFPLRMKGMPADEIQAKVREAARFLRIEDLLDRKPRELSGGQRQRVAIGRAIVRKPRLFLFDEPLSNLDAKLRNEMRLEIAELHRTLRSTMIYVTHDQVEAMTLANQIVVIHRGKIEQIGSPNAIYSRPATRFVAEFVGFPPMNFIEGRVEGGTFEGRGFSVPVRTRHEGAVSLGVRPEDIRFGCDGPDADMERMEQVGADRYVHVRCAGVRLVGRLPGDETIDKTTLSFSDRLHLFADGKRVPLEVECEQEA